MQGFRGDAGRDGFIGKERIDLHEESFEGVRFFVRPRAPQNKDWRLRFVQSTLSKSTRRRWPTPTAGKTHGDIGAKATETADGDKASVQFFLGPFSHGARKGRYKWRLPLDPMYSKG